jgi:prepilin-type N-terminal cleavage/methylation domain-containing protein
MIRSSPPRRGFTLVELLVVTAMLAAFMGLIVTGMRSSGGQQNRQLTQLVGATMTTAQTRALASEAGTALILEPAINGMPLEGCNAIYRAEVPPLITGTCGGVPPVSLSSTFAAATLHPLNTDAAALTDGYKIRFFADAKNGSPPSVWMTFLPASNQVRFNASVNQTADNTVWPVPLPDAPLDFEIARRPQPSTVDFAPTPRSGIDVRYSGFGDEPTAMFGTLHPPLLSSAAAPYFRMSLSLNRQGSMEAVLGHWVDGSGNVHIDTAYPTAALYLLVATLDDIDGNTSLSSAASRWISIAPASGRVTVSQNNPQPDPAIDSGTAVNVAAVKTAVKAARIFARAGAAGGSE